MTREEQTVMLANAFSAEARSLMCSNLGTETIAAKARVDDAIAELKIYINSRMHQTFVGANSLQKFVLAFKWLVIHHRLRSLVPKLLDEGVILALENFDRPINLSHPLTIKGALTVIFDQILVKEGL